MNARTDDRPVVAVVAELRRTLAPFAPKEHATQAPIPTGIEPLDRWLGGGLPRGHLVELAGWGGRMTTALSALAGATRQGLTCALIDPAQAFDAQAAQARGVVLHQVLWVLPSDAKGALQAADLILSAGGFGLVVLYLASVPAPARAGHAFVRLARQAAQAGAALLLLTDSAMAGAAASVTLHLAGHAAGWRLAPGGRMLLRGRHVHLHLQRSRLGPSDEQDRLTLFR